MRAKINLRNNEIELIINEPEETIKEIRDNSLYFIDTETQGFYGKVKLFQLTTGKNKPIYILEKEHFDSWFSIIIPSLLKGKIIAFNAHYDLSTLRNYLKFSTEKLIFECLFLSGRLTFPKLNSHSLDAFTENVLNFKGLYEDKKDLQKSFDSNKPLTKEQIIYGAKDVWVLPYLYEKCDFDSFQYNLDKKCVVEALNFQYKGMPIDINKLEETKNKLTKEIEAIDLPKHLNVNSYQQVRAFLRVKNSDKLALLKLKARGNKKAGLIQKKRSKLKLVSFIDKYENLIDGENKIYGYFSPSAKSGRFTSSEINQQQHPRDLKCVFGYPEDSDKVLIYSDYPQLELRTIAAITKDVLLTKWFNEGLDPHGEFAKLRFGPNYTKEQRYMAKTGNFGLLYGAGGAQYAKILLLNAEILIDDIEGIAFKKYWLKTFYGINAWQQKRIRLFKSKGINCTPFGRYYTAERITDFLNIENQGAGAEVSKIALLKLFKYLRQEDLYDTVELNNYIHDSFVLTAPKNEEIYIKVANILGKAMHEGWLELTKKLNSTIPCSIDVFVGHNWGNIEDNYLYKTRVG